MASRRARAKYHAIIIANQNPVPIVRSLTICFAQELNIYNFINIENDISVYVVDVLYEEQQDFEEKKFMWGPRRLEFHLIWIISCSFEDSACFQLSPTVWHTLWPKLFKRYNSCTLIWHIVCETDRQAKSHLKQTFPRAFPEEGSTLSSWWRWNPPRLVFKE